LETTNKLFEEKFYLTLVYEIKVLKSVSDTYCRSTAWLNADTGGVADKETLSALVSKYGSYACIKPSKISVRVATTKQNVTLKGGPQIYSTLDTVSGFQCLQSMQPDGSACLDYEVQLCCPGTCIRHSRLFICFTILASHFSTKFLVKYKIFPAKIIFQTVKYKM
jgi:hypothetical protein